MAKLGQAATGALGGAASGAAIGSVVPGIGTAIGAIGGGIIGALPGLLASDDNTGDQISALQQQAMDEIRALKVPTPESMQVILDKYKSAGVFTPEMETAIMQNPSQMNNIVTDPRLKEAQMSALQSLQKAGQTGLTAEDMAALNDQRRGVSRDVEAKNQQIMQEMQARGAGGGGNELAMKMNAAQQGADRQSQQGDRTSAMAQMKSLQAISNAGALGGQMQSQDFNQKSAVAKANDEISAFNQRNRQSVNNTNTGARNTAAETNLRNEQNINNLNTGVANDQQKYNKGVLQTDYMNRLKQAQGIYDAGRNYAGDLQGQQDRSNQTTAGVANGVASTGMGLAQMYAAQKKQDAADALAAKKNASGFGSDSSNDTTWTGTDSSSGGNMNA